MAIHMVHLSVVNNLFKVDIIIYLLSNNYKTNSLSYLYFDFFKLSKIKTSCC